MRSARVAVCVMVLSAALSCACGRSRSSRSADARETAYRANNRGVALLEQFRYEPAVDAFREALKVSPGLRLAEINLSIALFYAGRAEDAAAQARAATNAHPDAPQPPFILGLVARLESRPEEAADAFTRVLALDPDDVGAQVNLALVRMQQQRYEEAATLVRSALAREPYNATAAYNLSLALTRQGNTAAGAEAMARFEQLRGAGYAITYSQTYLEQGRYAEAVASTGAEPDLAAQSAPRVTFADITASILNGPEPPAGDGAPTLVDIDRDGDLDLVIATGATGATGASGIDGQPGARPAVRVFLNNRPRLEEVTSEVGLDTVTGIGLGSVAADVDNDTRPDLLVLTREGPRLFAQGDGGRFREIRLGAAASGLTRPFRSAALADVDHDGDVDIVLGGPSDGSSGTRLLQNNGNATFSDTTAAAGLAAMGGTSNVVTIAPTDFDNRREIDLLMVSAAEPPRLFRNLRTGAFEDVAREVGLPETGGEAAALGDVNKDGFTDIFFGRASAPGVWALSNGRGRFARAEGLPASQGTVAVQIFDYDNDGLLDMFAVTSSGPRLFRNAGRSWQDDTERAIPAALRDAARGREGLAAIAAGDLDLDGDTDVVVRLGTGGLHVWRNDGGSLNPSLRVTLTGRVSNRSGVGAKVEMRAGSLQQKLETASTTPALVPADLVFGLGGHTSADVVRVIWPAGIVQAETELAAASTDRAGLQVLELNRKPSSCPYLFTWNGTRFEFVTDFLGGGEMGSWVGPAQRNVPNPLEHVRIEDRQLRERNGVFELRVTNELEEALFLDHLELVAVTHPANVEVFPDEGLRERPRPFRIHATSDPRPPLAATDDHGHDVLDAIAHVDRRYVDDFEVSSIRGYAPEHGVTLTLPAKPSTWDRQLLLLTGWTDYAFSSDNVAASQRGLRLDPPMLQVRGRDGAWRTVDRDVGFPIGRPQTLVVDVTRFSPGVVRLASRMRVYWDRILVAGNAPPLTPERLALQSATLAWRGFSAEVTPDGREPFSYDYHRVGFEAPWKLMTGRYTREGDVAELLQHTDDRFVVSRPGDELAIAFSSAALPPLPAGSRRTYLLRSVGYSKEMNLHSASPDQAAPLPFRAMTSYPYGADQQYPHPEDVDRFHHRIVSRSLPSLSTVSDLSR